MSFDRALHYAEQSRKLQKRLDKVRKNYGPPETWKQAIRHYCLAAGIKHCAVKKGGGRGSMYTDMDFGFGDIDYALLKLEKLVNDMRRHVGDIEVTA